MQFTKEIVPVFWWSMCIHLHIIFFFLFIFFFSPQFKYFSMTEDMNYNCKYLHLWVSQYQFVLSFLSFHLIFIIPLEMQLFILSLIRLVQQKSNDTVLLQFQGKKSFIRQSQKFHSVVSQVEKQQSVLWWSCVHKMYVKI